MSTYRGLVPFGHPRGFVGVMQNVQKTSVILEQQLKARQGCPRALQKALGRVRKIEPTNNS